MDVLDAHGCGVLVFMPNFLALAGFVYGAWKGASLCHLAATAVKVGGGEVRMPPGSPSNRIYARLADGKVMEQSV